MSSKNIPDEFARYARQIQFHPFKLDGQERLKQSRVLLVGCGALGCTIANSLVRAGVGFVRLVDRDWIEFTNLQRQSLFTEADVEGGLPKSIVAAKRLQEINSDVTLEPIVSDVNFENIGSYCRDVDLIMDGTDNFEIRFLINDASIKFSIPWVYGGCLGAEGQTMTIIPDKSACLGCLMQDGPPPPGTTPTCDTAGILEPIIGTIGSIQALEAIKILTGHLDNVSDQLQVFDLWENRVRQISLKNLKESGNCKACGARQFDWLDGSLGSRSAILCGRNAVQLSSTTTEPMDLNDMAQRLSPLGDVSQNRFMLRFTDGQYALTLFPDGRAIVKGTEDVAVAKRIFSQYVGN